MPVSRIESRYQAAREIFAEKGVDTERALGLLRGVSLTLPCWQGDDVTGSEATAIRDGSIQPTGHYPGKARNNAELRQDLSMALSLVPGRHRIGLHAMYGDFGGRKTDRDAVEPSHFAEWIAWARERGAGLDFNATCFAHPKADSGFTLSHPDAAVREFWVEHVRRSREVAAAIGRAQGSPCLHDLWIPDGSKDIRHDLLTPRATLVASLDRAFAAKHPPSEMRDFVESKLFGIGSEAYVVGSFELYLGYALSRGIGLCLDLGHFHPTESVADKIGSILLFAPEILLHVSRGVRWDSDHVPVLNDDLRDLAARIVRDGLLDRVHTAMDFFDASINRVGAYGVGGRAVLKAYLLALLEPSDPMRRAEAEGDGFSRLALLDEAKLLPFGAVWDRHCETEGAPPDGAWIAEVKRYEKEVLSKRG